MEKPPLGLIPAYIYWENILKSRINDIDQAMCRYMEAEKVIPQEWTEERNNLLEGLRGIEKPYRR